MEIFWNLLKSSKLFGGEGRNEDQGWKSEVGKRVTGKRTSLFLAAGLAIKDFARRGTSRKFPGFEKRRNIIWSQLNNHIDHVANFQCFEMGFCGVFHLNPLNPGIRRDEEVAFLWFQSNNGAVIAFDCG